MPVSETIPVPDTVDAVPTAVADQPSNTLPVPTGYYVQTGLFKHDMNAAFQLERLQMLGYEGLIYYEKPFYGVWIGPMETLDEAVQMQTTLRRDGYRTLIVSAL